MPRSREGDTSALPLEPDRPTRFSSIPHQLREFVSMSELQTIRRITVYADASLEQFLIEQFLKLGAKGYSVIECRGKGKHEIIEDPYTGISRVRIETLVQPAVAEKIMHYLARDEFKRRAVAACVESVEAPGAEHF
jgi:hypothetical protein